MNSPTAIELGGRLPAEPRLLSNGIRLLDGIEYATIRGFRPLLLDLYLPAAGGDWPAVVFLHGGGWGVGTRKSVTPVLDGRSPSAFERIAEAGMAVASVDYRLTGEAIFPAQLHDVKAAVRWLRSRASALGIDGDRLVAWGASAGGHLAALVGLTGRSGTEEGEVGAAGESSTLEGEVGAAGESATLEGEVGVTGESSAVCGVIDWYGPADLLAMVSQTDPAGPIEHDSPGSPEGSLIAGVVSENPDRARAASPITYVHSGAPPFQLKHGASDRAVPPQQSRLLARALAGAGVRVDLELIPEADHMWHGAADPEAIFNSSLEFALEVTRK